MNEKNDAVSDFATKKTIWEQRQYLPIFAVRQEVLCHLVLRYSVSCLQWIYLTVY